MISTFFPLKKLRRNTRHLLFLAILLVAIVAVYHEMIASRAWSADNSVTPDNWRRAVDEEWVRRDHLLGSVEYSAAWRFSYTPQTWKPEHMGQANLHVFEDWCGSSVADLRKNMHYPLYPHSRTTVQKLAVSPQWTNYGLRIFGYLHPFTDGEFVFGLSSDDNSEFWLSTDESPLNVQLLAWVGKTGKEWTAPGEFNKYVSQTSRPVWLSAQRRFFFEVIHKQNERGTDHVEVAWQLLHQGFSFTVIESRHISLYVNETALLLSDVAHIPQTAASHQHTPTKQHSVTADMQREDPRDTLYRVPLIDSRFLQGVLPDCSYKPSYIIKDFPLERYQGLQFVHMSYVHPNDYTRLTHMETDNSCFYPESPSYMKMFGFSRYMRLDFPEPQGKGNTFRGFHFQKRKSAVEEKFDRKVFQREIRPEQKGNVLFPDYGDDYDDYAQKRRRKLFSLASQEANRTLKNTSNTWPGLESRQGKDAYQNLPDSQKPVELVPSVPPLTSNQPLNLQQNFSEKRWIKKTEQIKPKGKLRLAKRPKLKSVERNIARPVDKVPPKTKKQSVSPSVSPKQRHMQTSQKMEQTHIHRIEGSKEDVVLYETATVAKNHRFETTEKRLTTPKQGAMLRQRELNARKHLREKEMEMNIPVQQEVQGSIHKPRMIIREKNHKKWLDPRGEKFQAEEKDKGDLRGREPNVGEREWGLGSDVDGTDDEDLTPRPVFDADINWSQTFQFSHMDLQAQRSDWIDLRCNISGNLLLDTIDALPVVKAFVDKLNEKHYGHFTLMRVVNVVMRNDGIQGSRYLLELELKDAHGQLLRLSHYIYTLILHSRRRGKGFNFPRSKPQQVLCNPVGFRWNPAATVHFIVPVKNQARWVQQLITDMEQLFRITGDTNFNLIITDYNSTDMDVRKALKKSKLPRYEYVKLAGNFERSAGLQAGVDLINDDHSIVFLCDLHIHFPPSIIDTIRKHCVEGYMAFAPIVLRLDCGATPADAKGYWEVNGFGLLGIYKSDLVKVGGMNTREFTDRWGGEDWELLDRILQAGLEVERIYLRNFFHHYHSKRGMWNRRIMPRHG